MESLLRAADLCVPFLDGRYNVDADEVLPDDGLLADVTKAPEDQSKGRTTGKDEELVDEELGPNVTVLVTGTINCL